jgi:sulfotransferase
MTPSEQFCVSNPETEAMMESTPPAQVQSKKFYFISGLPRSGSTLLGAILRQNPRFFAGMSSPLCPLFSNAMSVLGAEGSVLVNEERRKNVLRGLFTSWALDIPEGSVIFDTHRFWTGCLPALLHLLPETKLICTVRSVAAIMDSIERLMRANPLLPSRLFNDEERANVYTRTDALSQRNRLVGASWTCLKEAFFGPDARALLLVEYDCLARDPSTVMSLIYKFLGEKDFAHDFDHVLYDETAFDEGLRMPGMHKVRARVSFEPVASVLPRDLLERFSGQSFWENATQSHAKVISLSKEDMATI